MRKALRLLEISEVAHSLHLSTAMVREYADAGRLPPRALTSRGMRLFDPSDVKKFQGERERQKERV